MNLIDRVIEHEGFRSKPYQDHLGNWTFGHGLTWISEEESRRIVQDRLNSLWAEVCTRWIWLVDSPNSKELVDVIVEMSFQMGVHGVSLFNGFLSAAKAGDYAKAADEMMDSLWARQTPERAKELSDIVRGLA